MRTTRTVRLVSVVFAAASLVASCSKSSTTGTLPKSCAVTGSHVRLVARNVVFQQRCLGVTADAPFTIDFVNEDAGTAHNVVVYGPSTAASDGAKRFDGKVITGSSRTTYRVPALPAGSYVFRCEIHPAQMSGRLTVGPASG